MQHLPVMIQVELLLLQMSLKCEFNNVTSYNFGLSDVYNMCTYTKTFAYT
jgi:hypothetical protein